MAAITYLFLSKRSFVWISMTTATKFAPMTFLPTNLRLLFLAPKQSLRKSLNSPSNLVVPSCTCER